MESRREFLKDAATGALVLGAQGKWALAKALDAHAEQANPVLSLPAMQPCTTPRRLDEKRVGDLLDRAIALTREKTSRSMRGRKSLRKAMRRARSSASRQTDSAAKAFLRMRRWCLQSLSGCSRPASSRATSSYGIATRTIFRRAASPSTPTPAGVRCFGSDVSGYEEMPEIWGTARIKLSKILTRECAMVIGLPILKDHQMSGVTFAMKNMYGVVDRPSICMPAVAIPALPTSIAFR